MTFSKIKHLGGNRHRMGVANIEQMTQRIEKEVVIVRSFVFTFFP